MRFLIRFAMLNVGPKDKHACPNCTEEKVYSDKAPFCSVPSGSNAASQRSIWKELQ
jgi:hypothetical protein